MTGHDPDRRGQERPWWETGRPPQPFTPPKSGARRVLLVAATVIVTLLLALTVWGIITGAATMSDMPM